LRVGRKASFRFRHPPIQHLFSEKLESLSICSYLLRLLIERQKEKDMTTTIKLTALAISTMSIALFATRTTTVGGDKASSKPFVREVAKAFLVERALQRVEVAAQEVAEALNGSSSSSGSFADGSPDQSDGPLTGGSYCRSLRIQENNLLTGFTLPW
jgi:hypothetical protein